MRFLDEVRVKGRTDAVKLYEVFKGSEPSSSGGPGTMCSRAAALGASTNSPARLILAGEGPPR